MNNKISNPLLKQLISEIANKANQGRINDLNWGSIYESKKKGLKKEAVEKKPEQPKESPADEKGGDSLPPLGGDATGKDDAPKAGGELPPLDGADSKAPTKGGKNEPAAAPKDNAKASAETDDAASQEDAEKAKEDAAKAKAELEKAKAEKDQAEKELQQHSYVKLKSSGGTQFMLNKILSQAFKTNTIDELAAEMAQKLKITTQEEAAAFEEDMALYKGIPGMSNLISSIKAIAVKPSEAPRS